MRFLFILSAILMAGCASSELEVIDLNESNGDMEVYAVLRSVHRCSRISPEIEIEYAPINAHHFEVTLEERDAPNRNYGGGFWTNDGSGIIPEGALTRHYMGACPPKGTSKSYQYIVKAIDKNGQILDIDKYVFEQE